MKSVNLKKIKKPEWVIDKERSNRTEPSSTVWLFGIHAVREALRNKGRIKHSLMLTPNAYKKLSDDLANIEFSPQIIDARKFFPPIDKNSVHQGVALEVSTLNWGSLSEVCNPKGQNRVVIILDRVTDPQNVGAILRSAQVLGATAVIAPRRHSCPETGSLAKSASGSLDKQPYLRVPNLARAIRSLKQMGYTCVGLDSKSDVKIESGLMLLPNSPIAILMGSEGLGLRELTLKNCDFTFKISSKTKFASLNVSNAAVLALYLTIKQVEQWSSVK